MDVELRFFANFREAVGQKTLEREYDPETSVGAVLESLEAEFPDLDGNVVDENGEIQPQLSILKNGRDVVHLDGPNTTLESGDTLSVFPPVAGGAR